MIKPVCDICKKKFSEDQLITGHGIRHEIEIRTLHEKVDHLLLDQWSKMMNIQEIQIELLQEIHNILEGEKTNKSLKTK